MEKLTVAQIVDETREAYSDASNRGTKLNQFQINQCMYLTPEGKMCAVGRCLVSPTPHGGGVSSLIIHSHCANLDVLLKPQYRGHPTSFWVDLQMVHDNDSSFRNGTWSEAGLRHLENLKRDYAKNEEN